MESPLKLSKTGYMVSKRDSLAIVDALDRIYCQVPDAGCRGLCHESCGPIMCGKAEWDRVRAALPNMPPLDQEKLSCPALVNNRCAAYAVRPLICRLFAVVKAMRCPHGCKPKRWVTEAEAKIMIDEVMRLSNQEIGGPVMLS